MARDINEPGGDYITVTVEQNGVLAYKRECVLTELLAGGQVRRYKVDDTDFFQAQDGVTPLELAQKLLRPRGNR